MAGLCKPLSLSLSDKSKMTLVHHGKCSKFRTNDNFTGEITYLLPLHFSQNGRLRAEPLRNRRTLVVSSVCCNKWLRTESLVLVHLIKCTPRHRHADYDRRVSSDIKSWYFLVKSGLSISERLTINFLRINLKLCQVMWPYFWRFKSKIKWKKKKRRKSFITLLIGSRLQRLRKSAVEIMKRFFKFWKSFLFKDTPGIF